MQSFRDTSCLLYSKFCSALPVLERGLITESLTASSNKATQNNKQPMGCDVQLARTQIGRGKYPGVFPAEGLSRENVSGKIDGEICSWGKCSGSNTRGGMFV